MPVKRYGDPGSGGIVVSGPAIDGMRAITLLYGIRLYIESGVQPSRRTTPAVMRRIATEFTGRSYPRSRKGLKRAEADLTQLCAGKTLDQLGAGRRQLTQPTSPPTDAILEGNKRMDKPPYGEGVYYNREARG